ncbi:hypothetical protein GQ55_9G095600 [Panicum hallii var. hallii]|uniref:Uncharacterized protein n=1 Tax=Panicum hallii var. hallii TaxID=1504633 RepID=A0A2T7C1P2_9POAL|nr:hypothetical protein GQ55_9G095600 [Panicum hallii var. hallii]
MCVRPPGNRWGTAPLMCPFCFAFPNIQSSASAARLKRRGDSGSPCRRPLWVLKYGLFSPLQFIQTLPPLTGCTIQFRNVG